MSGNSNFFRIWILLTGFLFLAACGSGAVTKTAVLTVAAEVPAPVAPPAINVINGTATVTLTAATNELTGSITITGDFGRVTLAHIHDGDVGVAGPIVVGLQDTGNGVWVVPAGTVLTAAQAARFVAGGYYVNVHTLLNPGGEIRGQLAP